MVTDSDDMEIELLIGSRRDHELGPDSSFDDIMRSVGEFAVATFNRRGYVAPMWHAMTSQGEHIAFATPWGSTEERHAFLLAVREAFAHFDVVRYVMCVEMWALTADVERDPTTTPDKQLRQWAKQHEAHGIAEHPDRQEIVMVQGEDHARGLVTVIHPIIRPVTGKPHLGTSYDYPAGHMEGRMIGLLPVKGPRQ